MKTASFFTYTGPGRISIARWAPPKHPAGYRLYKPLAPHRSIKDLPIEAFRIVYVKCQLGALDARAVWSKLHELAGDAEPVLLCWEKAPFHADNWCHRHMVAEWLQEQLGEAVPEMDAGAALG